MMKSIFISLFALSALFYQPAKAEDVGVFKINPQETKTFTYRSNVGQVFAYKVKQGPELPDDKKGLQFGWEKQSVFCQGKGCATAGGWLLFCPKTGVITGEITNFTTSNFEVAVERVECEGKDAGSIRCPRASTLKAMCN